MGNLSSELSNMKLDPGKLVSPTIVVGATPVFSGNDDHSVHSPPSPLQGRRIEFEGGRKEGKSEEDNSKTIAALPPLILINPNGANDDEEDGIDTNNNNPVVKEDVSFDVLHNEYSRVVFKKGDLSELMLRKVYRFNHNKKSYQFVVPADCALLIDVMFLLSEGKALNYSNEDHFLRCRERDINVLRNKYAETDDKFDTKIPSIEDLLKECQKVLTQVRGTNAIGKNRIKNCLTKKNLNNLWKQKKAKPATVHAKGDVRDISNTLGALYRMDNVDEVTNGQSLLRPEFCIGSNGSVKAEKIKQHLRYTITKHWKRDMKKYGKDQKTHTLKFGYKPPQYDPTVSPEVPEAICEKVEEEIRQLKEEYVSQLKEAGNYDEKFDEKEETKEEKYATVESHEKDEAEYTRKQHEKYDERMTYIETSTELNVKNFNKAKSGQVNYKTIVGWFNTGLPKVNKKYGLDITPKQCFHFDQATYENKKKQKKNNPVLLRNLINKLVDTLHIRLKEKCRMRNCQNKPSDTDDPTELGGKWDQDHTDEGTSQHGDKTDKPSNITNLTKKKEEKLKSLPTCTGCHDKFSPKTRLTSKPLSRTRRQVNYKPGIEHHSGKDVVTSLNYMNFVMDLLASGALSGGKDTPPTISSRSLNAKCYIYLGVPLTMLNTDPTWKWDETTDLSKRIQMVNIILSNAALRLSERCANNECPKPDIVNSTTWALGGGWHWDHEEGKDMGVSKLGRYHPIHLLNEIMRWCAATCSGCHAIKTRLTEYNGHKGRVFDKTLIPSCQAGGQALVEVLYGMFNPSGRLTTTIYQNSYMDEVALDDMQMRPYESSPGRTYRFYNGSSVVYPFGYGLSYSKWDYSIKISEEDDTVIAVNVSNKAGPDGSNSVLLFHQGPNAGKKGNPIKALIDFEKVYVSAGDFQTVKFNIKRWIESEEKGTHTFMVGPSDEYFLQITVP